MIRVVVVGESLFEAQGLARMLAEDERLEIVETRAVSVSPVWRGASLADVVLAIGGVWADLPEDGPPVVVLEDRPLSQMALGGAVRAWLSRNASPAEIAAAVAGAASDLTCLTQEQARRWLRTEHENYEDEAAPAEALTPRERQVLRMLSDGLANKEIAGRLQISDHTAKFHVAQILAKLGAASRAEAVAIGIRRGLVPI